MTPLVDVTPVVPAGATLTRERIASADAVKLSFVAVAELIDSRKYRLRPRRSTPYTIGFAATASPVMLAVTVAKLLAVVSSDSSSWIVGPTAFVLASLLMLTMIVVKALSMIVKALGRFHKIFKECLFRQNIL